MRDFWSAVRSVERESVDVDLVKRCNGLKGSVWEEEEESFSRLALAGWKRSISLLEMEDAIPSFFLVGFGGNLARMAHDPLGGKMEK